MGPGEQQLAHEIAAEHNVNLGHASRVACAQLEYGKLAQVVHASASVDASCTWRRVGIALDRLDDLVTSLVVTELTKQSTAERSLLFIRPKLLRVGDYSEPVTESSFAKEDPRILFEVNRLELATLFASHLEKIQSEGLSVPYERAVARTYKDIRSSDRDIVRLLGEKSFGPLSTLADQMIERLDPLPYKPSFSTVDHAEEHSEERREILGGARDERQVALKSPLPDFTNAELFHIYEPFARVEPFQSADYKGDSQERFYLGLSWALYVSEGRLPRSEKEAQELIALTIERLHDRCFALTKGLEMAGDTAPPIQRQHLVDRLTMFSASVEALKENRESLLRYLRG